MTVLYIQPRFRTAIHEAGHAVIALEEGRRFQEIVMASDGIANASVRNMELSFGDDDLVRIHLAGIMAVRMSRVRWSHFLFESAFNDIGVVADFYRDHSAHQRQLQWNVDRTEQLLRHSWTSAEIIAAALLQSKSLTFDETSRLHDEGRNIVERRTPPGRLAHHRWLPLLDRIASRIEYPNGIADLIKKHGTEIATFSEVSHDRPKS